MTDRTITVTREGGVTTIALDRAGVMNALNRPTRLALTEALLAARTEARCIVLTGSGRAFCAGQDLTEAAAMADIGGTLRIEYEPMLAAITDSPVPVLAAVNGLAVGAGANLALACDVVIAAESASFTQAFTRIGLIPDAGGTWTLPRQIGMARAMGAMLFAEPVSARRAADWGMIWEAVPDGGFQAAWRARAGRLAAGPTSAFTALKEALRASPGNALEAQLALEAGLQARCGASADFREGVAAFLAKRPARFTGR